MVQEKAEPDGERPDYSGALSRLIRGLAGPGQGSYRPMGERAQDPVTGIKITWQYIWKLGQTPPVFAPGVPRLRALAAGLEVPFRRVQEAAALQWLDYKPVSRLDNLGSDIRAISEVLGELPERDVLRFRRMIEAYSKSVREDP
jgi:hypothetical protein